MEERDDRALNRIADALTRLADLYEKDLLRREAERQEQAQDRVESRARMRAMDVHLKGLGPWNRLTGPLTTVLMVAAVAFFVYTTFVRP
jgi:ABC-type anion transport system duplicated permease subunit